MGIEKPESTRQRNHEIIPQSPILLHEPFRLRPAPLTANHHAAAQLACAEKEQKTGSRCANLRFTAMQAKRPADRFAVAANICRAGQYH